jgi:hypothetical protein
MPYALWQASHGLDRRATTSWSLGENPQPTEPVARQASRHHSRRPWGGEVFGTERRQIAQAIEHSRKSLGDAR